MGRCSHGVEVVARHNGHLNTGTASRRAVRLSACSRNDAPSNSK